MFNKTKLLEEMAELNEKILKEINKSPEYKPSKEDIIEEIGDFMIRLQLYILSEDLNPEKIESRITYKLNRLLTYIKEGKYVNGI